MWWAISLILLCFASNPQHSSHPMMAGALVLLSFKGSSSHFYSLAKTALDKGQPHTHTLLGHWTVWANNNHFLSSFFQGSSNQQHSKFRRITETEMETWPLWQWCRHSRVCERSSGKMQKIYPFPTRFAALTCNQSMIPSCGYSGIPQLAAAWRELFRNSRWRRSKRRPKNHSPMNKFFRWAWSLSLIHERVLRWDECDGEKKKRKALL